MYLTQAEKDMLTGKKGEKAQKIMEELLELDGFFGSDKRSTRASDAEGLPCGGGCSTVRNDFDTKEKD